MNTKQVNIEQELLDPINLGDNSSILTVDHLLSVGCEYDFKIKEIFWVTSVPHRLNCQIEILDHLILLQ